jgi:amino acid transporter
MEVPQYRSTDGELMSINDDRNRSTGASVPSDDRDSVARGDTRAVHDAAVAREREAYGGIKIGSAFFGWLTAVGMAVLLTAVLAAAGTALGLATGVDVEDATEGEAQTIGIIGGILIILVMFVAYYCGGYVAGRMARFNGVRQGIAVWLWALVIAIIVALIGLIAGTQYDLFANVNVFPRIPLNEGDLTVGGIVTAIIVALAALGGAILGGFMGTRFHRKVDRAAYPA